MSKTSKARSSSVRGSNSSSSSDSLMAQRKARFAQRNNPSAGFGLVSRGEDFTLKEDPSARRAFFKQITDAGHQTNDKTLMDLRKLREGILSSKEPDLDFKADVLIYSLKVALNLSNYQSYLPTINQLLEDDVLLEKLNKDQSDLLHLSYILHISHIEKNHLEAFRQLYRIYPKPEGTPQTVNLLIKLDLLGECIPWLELWNKLKTESKELSNMLSSQYTNHQKESVKLIKKAFRQLPIEVAIKYTYYSKEYFMEQSPNGITVNDSILKF